MVVDLPQNVKVQPVQAKGLKDGRGTWLLDCLPGLQHDPNRPEHVLKVDADEEGIGGDDPADVLWYLVATKARKLAGV